MATPRVGLSRQESAFVRDLISSILADRVGARTSEEIYDEVKPKYTRRQVCNALKYGRQLGMFECVGKKWKLPGH